MENNRYIFDTSFIFALLISEDASHAQAVERFRDFSEASEFFINELTHAELLTVSNYKLGNERRREIQKMFSDMRITFLQGNIDGYITFFNFLDKRISVVDASIIYDSLRDNLDILSFDKELLAIEKSLV